MTAPRAFYLTLPNGQSKLLSVRTRGELLDIVLVHYSMRIEAYFNACNAWAGEPVDTAHPNILKEVIA